MEWLPLILIVVGVIVMVGIGYVLRRRRAAAEELPDIGTPTDYTSLPLEEPTSWRDRFNNLSVAGKILLLVVPLLLIVGGIVIVLALSDSFRQPAPEGLPPPPVYTLTITSASLVNPRSMVVRADSTLPQDTPVEATLQANSEPFAWNTADSARTRVAPGGQIEVRLAKGPNAPAASEAMSYTVTLKAQAGGVGGVGGQEYTSVSPIAIPQIYAADFYARASGAPAPTAEAATAEPTAAPTEVAAATAVPATPAPAAGPAPLSASVFNGGNVRSLPQIAGSQIYDQINAAEQVQLLQKTTNGQWYLIKNLRDKVGWVSATLLQVDPAVSAKVPIQGQADPLPTAGALDAAAAPTAASEATAPALTGLTARVFNGGNVRSQPSIAGSQVLDQINAAETVQLLRKTANGQWYQIKDIRNITGWVNVTLLTIDPAVAAKVPVGQ